MRRCSDQHGSGHFRGRPDEAALQARAIADAMLAVFEREPLP